MNRKLWTGVMIIVALIILAGFLPSVFNVLSLIPDSRPDTNNPALLLYYRKQGTYIFDQHTILRSLEKREPKVFVPLLTDPNDIEVEDDSIAWNQSDYLKVADALSQEVWGEPLDFGNWAVYRVGFSTGCVASPQGFNDFYLTYYKTINHRWERQYSARTIEIRAWRGEVTWGGDSEYTASVFQWWHPIDLAHFKITAEDALRIAEESGGAKARATTIAKCSINVRSNPQDNGVWSIDYFLADFRMSINPYTGKYKILRSSQ